MHVMMYAEQACVPPPPPLWRQYIHPHMYIYVQHLKKRILQKILLRKPEEATAVAKSQTDDSLCCFVLLFLDSYFKLLSPSQLNFRFWNEDHGGWVIFRPPGPKQGKRQRDTPQQPTLANQRGAKARAKAAAF